MELVSKKKKVSELFIKLLLLIPLSTLVQEYIPGINKILFSFSVVFLFAYIFSVKLYGYKWCVLFLGGIIWAIALCNTTWEMLYINENMAIYYIFCIAYLLFFLSAKDKIWDELYNSQKYIFFIIFIYTIILVISIPLPISYTNIAGSTWGDALYFVSFSGSPNRVGQASLFICSLMILLLVMKFPQRRALLLFTIPNLYVFLMGGSRTYFVLGTCVLLLFSYVYVDNPKRFKYIFWGLLAVFCVLLMSSNMMNKFAGAYRPDIVDNRVFWIKLTSARSAFWLEQLSYFFNSPILYQFFGNGININWIVSGIWAHNDFIEIVCSYGYIGLLLYLITIVLFIRGFLNKVFINNWIKWMCVFIWLFNASFNMFFPYFNAMLSYSFLLLAFCKYKKVTRQEKDI